MATAIALTRFSDVKEINAYETKGIKSTAPVYAATSALVALSGFRVIYAYAQLTGAMTINLTTTNLLQGDELEFWFEADSSQRIVTFGTGFISSGTVTVTAAKGATCKGVFDGTNVRIYAREIYA